MSTPAEAPKGGAAQPDPAAQVGDGATAEAIALFIASFPAHEEDRGPDNEVIGDLMLLTRNDLIGEVPEVLVRLAEAIKGRFIDALAERAVVAEEAEDALALANTSIDELMVERSKLNARIAELTEAIAQGGREFQAAWKYGGEANTKIAELTEALNTTIKRADHMLICSEMFRRMDMDEWGDYCSGTREEYPVEHVAVIAQAALVPELVEALEAIVGWATTMATDAGDNWYVRHVGKKLLNIMADPLSKAKAVRG